ncbi:phenylacetaldoxime dehydratase family protein [Pseudonocardia sp. RS11V-5]|uniref:phenylacetaldoxime dehydratase family protein n=1 Tax=Pseudonocardia terrae TaxID=2905831 RepID=UPI001E5FA0B7|nr:phenylacetaldoxime dehydratase family protein [Pseudonocardia terrae]MCE3550872.1 phenylacetaldoxime dehydratase family protein [Pseudonocardia terrae]
MVDIAVESAVPAHLRTVRGRPLRVPEDYVPQFPSFVARHPESVSQLVMAYLGGAATPDLDGADGPRHHDRAVGHGETVTTAYWDDPTAFERWAAAHRAAWLATPGHWLEVAAPGVERYETIFGRRSRPEGAAVLAEGFSGAIREHGYWGGMRDRMAAAQTDPLHRPGDLAAEQEGDVVRVRPQGSLCLIRSGQDWTDTTGDERRMYLEEIEPRLREGMEFLRTEGRAVGCLANRYLTVLDADGAPSERSYGWSWWRSLADLERWAESHPTHLEIFGAFGRMAAAQRGRIDLRLYHEVVVVEPHEAWFGYRDCAPGTGLLP